MSLSVVSPLFTGEAVDENVLLARKAAWFDFTNSPRWEELCEACGKGTSSGAVSFSGYAPGKEIEIRHRQGQDPVKILFPSHSGSMVPKGFVVRLHLLFLQERATNLDPSRTIFGFIDGSQAFSFESLKLLIEPFRRDNKTCVVFGKRPEANSGMIPERKAMEEFEQYLLFKYRKRKLTQSFGKDQLRDGLLPDGQAGCWAFKLSAASQLPLTASGYEIEYDLLACAVDAGLKCAYTRELIMNERKRHSSAGKDPIGTSIRKLGFIEKKLGIGRIEVGKAWTEFSRRFRTDSMLDLLRPGYEQELMKYCNNSGEVGAK